MFKVIALSPQPLLHGFAGSLLLALTACNATQPEPPRVQAPEPVREALLLARESREQPLVQKAEMARYGVSSWPAAALPAAPLADSVSPAYREAYREQYQQLAANPVHAVAATPVSTFSLGLRRDTVFDNDRGTSTPRRGFELDIRLPIFDWGSAQRDAMNAQSLAAASRYESTVRGASSQLRESYSAYRTAFDVARHYRDEIVPLRKTMAEENVLRYNGMLIGVFELLADTRDQISSVTAAINAYQQFWLADAALAASMTGKPTAMAMAASGAASGGAEAGH